MKLSTILTDLDAIEQGETGVWMAKCPAHDDSDPSFKITNADPVLMYCHAGCSHARVLAALGIDTFHDIERDAEEFEGTHVERSPVGYLPGEPRDKLAREYAEGRWGVTDEDFERLGLRGDGTGLVVPLLEKDTGVINSYQTRSSKGWISPPGPSVNEGYFEGTRHPEVLTVAESPGDAIALNMAGFSVIFTAGASVYPESWLLTHQFEYDHIVLCGDYDEAGRYRDSWLMHCLYSDPDAPKHPSVSKIGWEDSYGGIEMPVCAYSTDGDVSSMETDDLEQIVMAARHSPDSHISTMPQITTINATTFMSFPVGIAVPEIPDPTMLLLTDGTGLLYPGETHSFFGEPGSGKTWLALLAIKEQLEQGNTAVLIDAEDRWEKAYARLLQLGISAEIIAEHFIYVKPLGKTEPLALDYLTNMEATLVVIDSTGESMSIEGLDGYDDLGVASWNQKLLAPLLHSGAAVVTLDHVAKSPDNRFMPIGSQRKLAGITGAAYNVKKGTPWSRHNIGTASMHCAKDRNGKIEVEHAAADVMVVPLDDGNGVSIKLTPGAPKKSRVDTLTENTQRISDALLDKLRDADGALPKMELIDGITGSKTRVNGVVDFLVDSGRIDVRSEDGRKLHTLAMPTTPPLSGGEGE